MKLRELISEYDANGAVIQDAGNGSTTEHGRFVAVEDLQRYYNIDLSELSNTHVSDDGVPCTYASEWITEGEGDNAYRVRVLF